MQHELVNDKIGDQSFMVTYCPLCASAMVFGSAIDGKDPVFGVSGLLYQSEVELGGERIRVRYDQKARHLLAFESDGATPVPVVVAFWFAWQAFYPETEIWEP